MEEKKKNLAVLALKLGIAAVVLTVLAKTGVIDLKELGNVIRGGWGWVLLGGLLFLCGVVMTSWRWLLLVRAQGIEIPFWLALRLTFLGLFFSVVMPGATGGDLARAYYVYRWGTKRAAAVTTIFLDRIIGIYCMIGTGAVMVLAQANVLWRETASRSLVYAIPILFLVLTLGLAALFTKRVRYIMTATDSGPPIPFGAQFLKVYRALDLYRGAKSVIVWAVLISVVNTLSLSAGCLAFGMAIGDTKMSAMNYFQAVPIGMVVNGLPILPMGLGVGEIAFESLFKIVSTGGSEFGAETALLFHVVVLFWSAVGALAFLTMRSDIKDLVEGDTLDPEDQESDLGRIEQTFSLDYCGRKFVDYAGAVHFHTRYSDGSESMEKVVQEAKRTGLDFFVVSDHDTLEAAADGWEGWQDGVLSIVGAEVSSFEGHCLTLGLQDCSGLKGLSPPDYLAEIKRRGASAFIAHPTSPRRPELRFRAHEWRFWDSPDFDGLEIWTYMHDWARSLTWRSLPLHILDPTRWIKGPDPKLLAKWDELCQTRRVVGLGAIDNHALKLPFRKFPLYIVKILPHRFAFQTLRTHVLCEPFTENDADDVRRVTEAIRAGHCYAAYDLLAEARGFCFSAEAGSGMLLMGDEAAFAGETELHIQSPRAASLALVRDGSVVAEEETDSLSFKATAPGVYRAEARLEGRPWVFTNPIYLREQ